MRCARLRFLMMVLALVYVAGCGDNDESPPAAVSSPILLSPEGNRLNAYDTVSLRKQLVVQNHDLDPNGRDINGQVCVFPDGSHRFIAGEDTNQPDPPPAWGVFQLHGAAIGSLSATQIGRLVVTFQDPLSVADPYGCRFLPDGRLLTTDIGNNAMGPASGQLTMWFPPLDAPAPRYCKLDVSIGTAQGIFVDQQERIYVASARTGPAIYRYTGPFPTSDDPAGGCGRTDSTGKPLVDSIIKEQFIRDHSVPTPNGIVQSPHGTFYVSSVLNGVIAEFDASGQYIRNVLTPVLGEVRPYPSTGTPLGLAIDANGTLYYADLGLTEGFEPGDGLGTVRRIRFENGNPLAPEKIDMGLDFPDGLGLLLP
jgi:hypothetical protein